MNTGFAADTLVHVERGVLPIGTLQAGEMVTSRQRDGAPPARVGSERPALSRLAQVRRMPVQAMVELHITHFASGRTDRVRLGTAQPVWTLQHGWLVGRQLRPGHAVLLASGAHALAQQVLLYEGAQTLWRPDVDDDATFHVGELGVWAGSFPLAGGDSPPAPIRPLQLEDATRPTTVLEIPAFFNGHLPERTLSDEEAARLGSMAELVRKKAQEQLGLSLDYDSQGVRWLESYASRRAATGEAARRIDQSEPLGAFLGACLVTALGGEWLVHADRVGVRLERGMLLFPTIAVRKRLEGGHHESLLTLYQTLSGIVAERRLPVGQLRAEDLASGQRFISVTHGAPVAAEDGRHVYATRLKNVSGQQVRVVAFAGFHPDGNTWRLADGSAFFTAEEFRQWYGQPGEWLDPGQEASDGTNWSRSFPVLWAYFGIAESGETFVAGSAAARTA